MTIPQIIIALWVVLGSVADIYENRKTAKNKRWWTGRIIGHILGVLILTYTLRLGGFW